MLSVKDLVKVYKAKKGGAEVRALDGVSIDFPECGMVFLLGKSGSGKSTLLNVAGGLDKPDSGEIIVKGKSSKDFIGADFDSYRNTYIGFIFQEYNILNEFNVETNISLALQLQGKKNDEEAVNKILEEVELSGLGKRKPNTLSGGQKQRVAIARALIKDPKIIMADEPTGSLDSETGKQVFDTLKKLSQDRLVIVVSHDREFAQKYGDRIIELKDGKILSDISKNAEIKESNIDDNAAIAIEKDENLTKAEFEKVWEMIKSGSKGDIVISADDKNTVSIKKVGRAEENASRTYFSETTADNIKAEKYESDQTNFIKSRLPFKHAAKIGASSVKTKPFRLIVTIFISMLAFGMFGIFSTMMMYDANFTAAKALEGTPYNSALMQKDYYYDFSYYSYYISEKGKESSITEAYKRRKTALISPSELNKLNNEKLGIKFAGVYTVSGNTSLLDTVKIKNFVLKDESSLERESTEYYARNAFLGFTDAGEKYLKSIFGDDVCLAGSYPAASDEIAVSEYMYEVIQYYGLLLYDATAGDYRGTAIINSPQDLTGKYIRIVNYVNGTSKNLDLKITGVYRTGSIDSKYNDLKAEMPLTGKTENGYDFYSLRNEFSEVICSGYNNLGYVADTFYDANIFKKINAENIDGGSGYVNYTSCYSYSEYTDLFQFTLPKWLKKYEKATKLYSFSNASEMPFSKIDSIADDETFISVKNLRNLASRLSYAEKIIGYDENDKEIIEKYKTNHVEFMNTFYKLDYYANNYWPDEAGQRPEQKNISQSDIAITLNALDADWDSWVKNNPKAIQTEEVICGDFGKIYYKDGKSLKISGVYVLDANLNDNNSWLVTENFIKKNAAGYSYYLSESGTNYVEPSDGKYAAVISPIKTEMDQLNYILSFNKISDDDSFYEIIENSTYFAAAYTGSIFQETGWIYSLIGVALAAVSALFLFNYISVSISDKKRDIGILRAMGAKGTDVFKIFFTESIIIAAICAVLAIILSIIACTVMNMLMVESIFAIQLLNFRFVNALIIFGIAALVAFAGTIIPVTTAAKKVPIESIRSL